MSSPWRGTLHHWGPQGKPILIHHFEKDSKIFVFMDISINFWEFWDCGA